MSIIEDIKQLVVQSKLFVPADKLVQSKNNSGKRGYKRGRGGGVVKIGQGGTLDPLADGVLGTYISLPGSCNILNPCSARRRERNKETIRLLDLYKSLQLSHFSVMVTHHFRQFIRNTARPVY